MLRKPHCLSLLLMQFYLKFVLYPSNIVLTTLVPRPPTRTSNRSATPVQPGGLKYTRVQKLRISSAVVDFAAWVATPVHSSIQHLKLGVEFCFLKRFSVDIKTDLTMYLPHPKNCTEHNSVTKYDTFCQRRHIAATI